MLSVPERPPSRTLPGRVRRRHSGVTLIEMSFLIAMVGVFILVIAERQLMEVREQSVGLTETLHDILGVSDALRLWERDNRNQVDKWPENLSALVSGKIERTEGDKSVTVMTGGFLRELPTSRFPPQTCNARNYNCEYRFWHALGNRETPSLGQAVTVQFVVESDTENAVLGLAQNIISAIPDASVVEMPGQNTWRLIRFDVAPELICEDPAGADSDLYAFRCGEHRDIQLAKGNLQKARRFALRRYQNSGRDGNFGLQPANQCGRLTGITRNTRDSTPLSGPGITMPVSEASGGYRMLIGTAGTSREQYLELIRDREPSAGGRGGTRGELATAGLLNATEVQNLKGGTAYPRLPTTNTRLDPDLLYHYGLVGECEREAIDVDPDSTVRLRISNRVGSGATVDDAHHDFKVGIQSGTPYLQLCADHRVAGTASRAALSSGLGPLKDPCLLGVTLRMDVTPFSFGKNGAVTQEGFWDIRLADNSAASVQTRLCRLEAASTASLDCSCTSSTSSCMP